MDTPQIKTEQSPQGPTIIVPSGAAYHSCMHMPELKPGQRWNAVIGKDAHVVMCETDPRQSEIVVEKGAQLELMIVQSSPSPIPRAIEKTLILHERSFVRLYIGAFESMDLAVTGRLVGARAGFGQHVTYFGTDKQQVTLNLSAVHEAEETMSRILTRGVAVDAAHVDFTGSVRIEQSGAGADTFVGHQGLLLGSNARIDALPRLDIETNDVKAAHSSAIHAIDEEQLFYLQSRGIEREESSRMIVNGFLEESLAIVRDSDIIKLVKQSIKNKQERLSYE
ncbi:MAG: SufD family Fe-S cluster assembly protein [Candidatus Kerfeldbacteria bacterium]